MYEDETRVDVLNMRNRYEENLKELLSKTGGVSQKRYAALENQKENSRQGSFKRRLFLVASIILLFFAYDRSTDAQKQAVKETAVSVWNKIKETQAGPYIEQIESWLEEINIERVPNE